MSLVITLGILVALGLYLWLIPWTSTSIGPFFGPKALTNPFLAAEMFLERHGVRIERRGDASDLAFAMASSDVLLMTNQSGDFTPEEVESLYNWVEAGGTLIYQSTTLYAEDGKYSDRILSRTSHRLEVSNTRDSTRAPSPDVHHSEVTCPEAAKTTSISMGEQKSYRVDMAKSVTLIPIENDGSQVRLAYIEPSRGLGRLVILTSLRQWRNNLIHCNDNARFLLDIVVRGSKPDIWLTWLDGANALPLYRQIWQWFPYTVATLGVLLLCWLWNRIPREQAIGNVTEHRENALEDYLLRKAIFRWRSAASLEQLNPLRAEILGRTRSAFTQSEYERISLTTGLTIGEIKSALDNNTWSGQREFIRTVATLSRLRGND